MKDAPPKPARTPIQDKNRKIAQVNRQPNPPRRSVPSGRKGQK